jgi:hypothetical protein
VDTAAPGRDAAVMSHGVRTVTALGDCHAPGTIAAAVHAGRDHARELGEPADPDGIGFRREVTALSDAS